MVGHAHGCGGLAGMLRTLKEMLRPPRIDTAAAFRDFVTGESALIAQKTATSYCRAKTLVFSHALFAETVFIEALARCRWEAFAAVLGDVLVISEGLLRAHAASRTLAPTLADLFDAVLAGHQRPTHRPEGWRDVECAFRQRIAESAAGEMPDPVQVALRSARRLYEELPIHTNYRAIDEGVIEASITFQMVALSDKMRRCIDAPAVARALGE
ncbi:MAG: hypothetical protein HY060_11495 [Proteobacteria bacterium]|nr:hypothetical protein [Pseudomonadota bacterium]